MPFPLSYVAIDANDKVVMALDEANAAGSFSNTGALGGTMTPSGSPLGIQALYNNGLVFPGTGRVYITGQSGSEPTGTAVSISCWFAVFANPTTGQPSHLWGKFYRPAGTWATPWTTISLEYGQTAADGNDPTKLQGIITVSATRTVIASATGAVSLGVWHLVSLTYDGANVRLYLDGIQVATAAVAGSLDYGTHGDWRAGAPDNASINAEPFNGILDDLRVANVVRSVSYYRNMFEQGKPYAANTRPVVPPIMIPINALKRKGSFRGSAVLFIFTQKILNLAVRRQLNHPFE